MRTRGRPPLLARDVVFRVSISTALLGEQMLATTGPPLRMAWVERGNPIPKNPETTTVVEVHRVERPSLGPRACGEGRLGDQVLHEALPRGPAGLEDREVAVRADRRAERDVEVDPGSRHLAVTIASRSARSEPG